MLLTARPAVAQTTCEQTPVFPENTYHGGYFANSCAMNGSGRMAVVGHIRSSEHQPDGGAAHIFTRVDGLWQEVETIPNSEDADTIDLSGGFGFGNSVDASGDFLIVSAPGSGSTGSAYIFERDVSEPVGQQWWMFQELPNPDAGAFGQYGGPGFYDQVVAIEGRIAAVANPTATIGTHSAAGRVYIFAYDSIGDAWYFEDAIEAPSPQAFAEFGTAIDISADRIIIGSPREGEGDSGAAHIFTRKFIAGTPAWVHEEVLTPDAQTSGLFGDAVAMDGNSAVIGAPAANSGNGRAALYHYSSVSGTWTDVATLPLGGEDATQQEFGKAVAISGSLVLIGAYTYDAATEDNVGTAYLYQKQVGYPTPGGGWVLAQQLLQSDSGSTAGDGVGRSVALQGDDAFVGAMFDEPEGGGIANAGSVLIFSDLPGCP